MAAALFQRQSTAALCLRRENIVPTLPMGRVSESYRKKFRPRLAIATWGGVSICAFPHLKAPSASEASPNKTH